MTASAHRLSRRHFLLFAAASGLATSVILRASPSHSKTPDAPLRIGTIGAGNLGAAVGALWVAAGHEVMFSSRNPETLKDLVAGLGPKARAGTVAEAIAFGDAVLLAVPYEAYPQVGRDYAEALRGKVVLDAGNANRSTLYAETQANGIGITTQKVFPGARIVRAFNAANNRLFTNNADRAAPRMAIPLAGDDADALELAERLVRDAGFQPLVVGPLKDADKFAMGTDGFGHVLSAAELAAKLGIPPPTTP